MGAIRRRAPIRSLAAVVAAASMIVLAVSPANAANTPSPSPSPSESPAPSPSPTATLSVEAEAVAAAEASPAASTSSLAQTKPTTEELAAGIARVIPYKTTATAVGADGLATATLATPSGLVPVILKGTLTSVADNPGTVRIRVGESTVELDAEAGGDFTLPIPPGSVDQNNLTIEVRNTLELPEGKCAFDTTTTETISNLRLGFVGTETPPTTIAGFFSPPVQKVTVVSPATSLAEAEATLAGAGALARRYDQSVELLVKTPEEFAKDPAGLIDTNGPNRIVALVPNDSDKVTITVDNPGVPRMSISGPVGKLAEAASSLESIGLGLAAVPDATELAETENPTQPGVVTLADLGAPKPTLSGLGRLTYVLNLRQDQFGGPVQAANIHLVGVHTPVPADASATASVLWNDQLVSSQLMGDGDQYTADISIAPSLMRRDNYLTIRVDAISRSGSCESGAITQSFQLDIDGNGSTIGATPGQSLDPGFARFPQSFGENLHLSFGSGGLTPALVEAGANVVIALQRAASRTLDVTCVDFPTFQAAAYPGVVIGAAPEDATALKAPLRFEPWRTVNLDLTGFTVTVDGPFAALEAYDNFGRDIVLLGGTDPAADSASLVSSLAEEAANGLYGWFGLTGTLLVAQPDAEFLALNTGSLVPQETVLSESRALPIWWILAIALVLLILLVRLFTLWLRKRRIDRAVDDADGREVPPADAVVVDYGEADGDSIQPRQAP